MGFQKSNCNSDVSKLLSHSSTLEYFLFSSWMHIQLFYKNGGRGAGRNIWVDGQSRSSKLLLNIVLILLICRYCLILMRKPNTHSYCLQLKSDGQEISTIEWQELKNRFPSIFVHNTKTPDFVYAGCVSVSKNYVEWRWKVE